MGTSFVTFLFRVKKGSMVPADKVTRLLSQTLGGRFVAVAVRDPAPDENDEDLD